MTAAVAVVGAGAIGGTVGAFLARAGTKVVMVDRDREHVAAMRGHGLRVEGPQGGFEVPVDALDVEELYGSLAAVLLAVKAQDTETATRAVLPHLAPDGMVVSLQNGLCEHAIAAIVGAPRTMGAFVNFSADYIGPGVVQYQGPGDFYVGEIDGRISPRAQALAAMLGAWGAVQVTDNIWGFLWSKLAYGAMLYATALADADQADVIDRYRPLMLELASELCEIALHEGVDLLGFHGFEPSLYLPRDRRDPARIAAATDEMLAYMRTHQKPRSGIGATWRCAGADRYRRDDRPGDRDRRAPWIEDDSGARARRPDPRY